MLVLVDKLHKYMGGGFPAGGQGPQTAMILALNNLYGEARQTALLNCGLGHMKKHMDINLKKSKYRDWT